MKKIILLVVGLSLLASGALAAPPNHVDTKVFLTEKTPNADGLWLPKFHDPQNKKEKIGYGYLTYRVWGPEFSFKFQGYKLAPKTPYALIYYPDPWPGTGLQILAEGTSNGGGNILLKGKMDTGTLPYNNVPVADANFPGAKIWLVPNYADLIKQDENGSFFFNVWPTDGAGILFETTLINYYAIPK